MCSKLGTVGFVTVIMIFTLPVALILKICTWIVNCLGGRGRQTLAGLSYRMLNIAWWLSITLCFWVCYKTEGLGELRRGMNKSRGKPRIMLVNHSSFFDSILGVALMPFCAVADSKTLASDHLLKIPVIAAVAVACDHLMVAYKSTNVDDFSVDKNSVTVLQEKFKSHVKNGGLGVWYPEGRLHPGTGVTLQQFKAGGFNLCHDVDCEIWLLTFLGNNVFWPKEAPVGGKPSRIGICARKLTDSSTEFTKGIAVEEGQDRGRQESLHLATECQKAMQSDMDRMVRENWGSIKPEKPDKSKPLLAAEK